MNRRVSLLLVMLLIFSMVMPVSGYNDVQDLPEEKAIQVLTDLGIAEGRSETEFAPDAGLTRAEAVTFVLRLMGIRETGTVSPSFTDVKEDHYAYGNIGFAQKAGIINGVSETEFAPDAAVQYSEAVKMLVSMLGYGVQAEAAGGYPGGFLAIATQIGLLEKTNANVDLTRGTMAQLIYNALDIPLFEKTSYGEDAFSYESQEKVTILSKYLHIEKVTGKVTATCMTILGTPSKTVGKDEVAIDNVVMKAGKSGAQDYVLQQVTAYVKEENSEKTILAVMPHASYKAITIESGAIHRGNNPTEISYMIEGVEHKVSLAGTNFVVNGRPAASLVLPESGTLTLILNGHDVESAIVWNFTSYVVENVDTDAKKVFFKKAYNGIKSYELDTEGKNTGIVLCDKNGTELELSKCKEWGILSVAESADKSIVLAVYSEDAFGGQITEMDANGDSVTISGKTYKLNKNIKEISPKAPELGLFGTFYRSFFGEIAAIDDSTVQNGAIYAYLVAAANGSGLSGMPKLKLYTENDEMLTLYTTDTVLLDGENILASQLLPEAGNVLFKDGKAIRQLLKVKINLADLICEIDTAEDYLKNPENDAKFNEFSKDYYLDENRNINGQLGAYITGSLSMFGSRLMIRDETKLFKIPAEGASDKEYSMFHRNVLPNRTAYTDGARDVCCMTMYDVDEGNLIGALVWELWRKESSTGGIELNTPMAEKDKIAVIKAKYQGLSEDGEVLQYLTLHTESNQELQASVPDDIEVFFKNAQTNLLKDAACKNGVRPDKIPVSALDIGDVIQYSVNSSNQLTMLNAVFRQKSPGEYDQNWNEYGSWLGVNAGNNYGGLGTGYGSIEHIGEYGAIVRVGIEKAEGTYERTYPKYGKYLLFERGKEKLSVISYEDMRVGDKVLNIKRSTTQILNIVYRK